MCSNNLLQLVNKNQSIKIVPALEVSIRDIGLNFDLDEISKTWFEQLLTIWKTWKRSSTLENHIESFLTSNSDPFRVTLVFVIKSGEAKDCKPKSLPYFIVETLQKWSQIHSKCPEELLKTPAFYIAIQQRNSHFLSLLLKTYQVKTIKRTIIPIIRDMIRADNCKLAVQVTIALELFQDISVDELLFPLILQDKVNMIDEYLSECPSQVQPLVEFLDNLLDRKVNLREFVAKFIEENQVNQVNYGMIHYKPFGKLVARLCKKFNIPIETCKNLSKHRTIGGLRHLIHQKYKEHNVSSSVWNDLVKDSLRLNAESGYEFINMLIDYDRNEARKWASYLNIPENSLPLALKDLSIKETEDELWDTEPVTLQKFYKLSLSDEQIVIINSAEKIHDMITRLSTSNNVVSIDCEWKPSFGAKQSQVALVQVATVNTVFLIDTILLNTSAFSSFWITFYKSLLDNAEIIKLGFGLEQDLKEMKSSIVGLGNMKVKGEGLLDMALLWKSLLNSGLSLPAADENSGNSLSNLVQLCFGSPLDKSEQCSNWQLRPLRQTQISYAALDAYVLIEIYNYLEKKCVEQGINFEEICNDTMTESKKKIQKKVWGQEKKQSLVTSESPKSPLDVKFIVEEKMCNLLPYLRYCGIDTVLIDEPMLWCDVINLAISEDRFILISKFKGTPSNSFPQNSILVVGKGSVLFQIQSIINTLNIQVQQSDLLTLCLKCNSKELRSLSPKDVYNLYLEYQSNEKINYHTNYDNYDDCDSNFDNFLSDSDGDKDLNHMTVTLPNKSFKTSEGAVIEINDVKKVSMAKKPAVVCETCGAFYWDDDELLKSAVETISTLTNLFLTFKYKETEN